MKKWLLPKNERPAAGLLDAILQARGFTGDFLVPRLASLTDPDDIPGIAAAARRVWEAGERGEKIVVYGDYDVDGVTGTTILLKTLRRLGREATYYIPDRYGEGYSLSTAAVRQLVAEGIKLIVTVDCGIASGAEIALARELGAEVVVTDHHNLPPVLPDTPWLVDPKMIAREHPAKYLAGAGVAFKFAWALLRAAGRKDNVFLTSLLDLAALGTLADVVPLTAENRVLAAHGLRL
ncbi:MAG TPA: DHH family phosphoesterase, partial [Candidatus Sulfotelmatobacter sp.]|nr:DHH family phosphoesterase [Candidatus Sulfotelmatobacter sp.]